MFCPRCGFKNDPKNNFCKKCGFNLGQYKRKLRQKQMNASAPTPSRSMRPVRPPKRNHKLAIIIGAVVVILILIAGVGTYTTQSWPFGNGPLSSMSQNSSSENKDVVTPIDQMWANVQSQANGNSASLAKFFTTGTSNYGYQQVNEWSNDQSHVDSLSKITLDPAIISKSISGDRANVKYKVAYRFEYDDGSEKDQTFIWRAHLKLQNGKWLIASNDSSNKPVSSN